MNKPTILERLENRFYIGDDPIPDTIRYIEELEARVKELECRMVELPDHIKKDIIREIDGFDVFMASKNGTFYAHHLRRIATELEDRNKEWDAELRAAFQEAGD